jgi:hypothetical protein
MKNIYYLIVLLSAFSCKKPVGLSEKSSNYWGNVYVISNSDSTYEAFKERVIKNEVQRHFLSSLIINHPKWNNPRNRRYFHADMA